MKTEAIKLHLTKQDRILSEIVNSVPFPSILSTQNVFHDLMSCIIEQQIHYRSTKKTFARLLTKASLQELTPDNFNQFENQALQDLKLSQAKYVTMVDLLEYFQIHRPEWRKMEEAEVYQTLGNVKGIGKWSIEMILIYTLERPDIFPMQDFHLKNMMKKLYSLEDKGLASAMKKIASRWTPYQSYGVKYVLAWKEAQNRNKL